MCLVVSASAADCLERLVSEIRISSFSTRRFHVAWMHVCRECIVHTTDLHIYNLDAVPPVYVVWNHVDTDKLTTANGGTFTSSSARLSSQSR